MNPTACPAWHNRRHPRASNEQAWGPMRRDARGSLLVRTAARRRWMAGVAQSHKGDRTTNADTSNEHHPARGLPQWGTFQIIRLKSTAAFWRLARDIDRVAAVTYLGGGTGSGSPCFPAQPVGRWAWCWRRPQCVEGLFAQGPCAPVPLRGTDAQGLLRCSGACRAAVHALRWKRPLPDCRWWAATITAP